MGNVHTLQQIEPFERDGCEIKVRKKAQLTVQKLYNELEDNCYSYLGTNNSFYEKEDTPKEYPDNDLFFRIQDDFKMRCGLDAFKENINRFSPYLENAYFEITDEEYGYLGKFRIKEGVLHVDESYDEKRSCRY